MVKVDLNTICEGEVAREFDFYLDRMVDAVRSTGKPASVNIKITLKPVPEFASIFTTHATVKATMPTVTYDSSAQYVDGVLETEASVPHMIRAVPEQLTIQEAIAKAEREAAL